MASHSSARALNDVSRNLDDEQLMALKENGGVIQTVAFRSYVNSEKNAKNREAMRALNESLAGEMGGFELLDRRAVRALNNEERAAYDAQMDHLREMGASRMASEVTAVAPPVDVADFVDHIDYLVNLIGLEHVGISSDFGMAAMRLGFAIASPEMIRLMSPYSTGSVNALVKWGAVAALEDTAAQERVRRVTLQLRKKTTRELESLGFSCIPSETNFFMMHTGRHVVEVGAEFRKRGVAVGRPFPPMLEHLRVSIGTEQEMDRFMTAFKDIFAITTATGSTRG